MLNSQSLANLLLLTAYVVAKAGPDLGGAVLAAASVLIHLRRAWTLPQDLESPFLILGVSLAGAAVLAWAEGWAYALFPAAIGLTGPIALWRQRHRKAR